MKVLSNFSTLMTLATAEQLDVKQFEEEFNSTKISEFDGVLAFSAFESFKRIAEILKCKKEGKNAIKAILARACEIFSCECDSEALNYIESLKCYSIAS